MTTVELIYDKDCPNAALAREQLLRAFAESGVPARWTEWDRADAASPAYVRAYGSPTVLINGKDVAGVAPAENVSCCRLYADGNGGFGRTPSAAMIAAALGAVNGGPASRARVNGPARWRTLLAVLPGIGASLLPAGVCPAC